MHGAHARGCAPEDRMAAGGGGAASRGTAERRLTVALPPDTSAP